MALKHYAKYGRLLWDFRIGQVRIYHTPWREILPYNGWYINPQWPFIQFKVEGDSDG